VKRAYLIIGALAIIALVATMPLTEAQIASYLPSYIVSALALAGWGYVAVGVAVIGGAYVVYHYSSTAYSYFTAYSYSYVSNHAWDVHKYDFPNIWGSVPPSRTTFNSKCKDNMNSKSAQKYIQKYDKRLISYNPLTKMVSIGETDGKTIITCYPKTQTDVNKKVATGEWLKVLK
jgi:hypothetical protein